MNRLKTTVILLLGLVIAVADTAATGSELWIGTATADITPDKPVPLTGYRTVRISQKIHSRCTANVLALEARDGDEVIDQAILVSCDLCVIRPGIQEGFRRRVGDRLPGFETGKLLLAATHTHTAPVLLQDRYQSYGDAMQPKEYVEFLYDRMADAAGTSRRGLQRDRRAEPCRPGRRSGAGGTDRASDRRIVEGIDAFRPAAMIVGLGATSNRG